MAERRKFSSIEKQRIYAKCNGRCGICGSPVNFDDMTVDHIIPLSRGGTNAMDNLRLACRTCNRSKGNLSDEEFCKLAFKIIVNYKRKSLMHIFTKEKVQYE